MLSAAIVAAGNLLYALTVKLFVLPTGLVMGGTTGLGLTANYLTGVPISAFVLAFNMVMLLLGLCVLGRRFAATTLLSSFIYPLALEFWQRLLGDYVLTEDVLLCTLFAGLGVGEPVRAAALTAKIFATGVVENCTLVGSAAADRVVKANQLAVLQDVTVQEASA